MMWSHEIYKYRKLKTRKFNWNINKECNNKKKKTKGVVGGGGRINLIIEYNLVKPNK